MLCPSPESSLCNYTVGVVVASQKVQKLYDFEPNETYLFCFPAQVSGESKLKPNSATDRSYLKCLFVSEREQQPRGKLMEP